MKAIIVGGGIGGLTTALMLRARGIGCELFEQSDTIRELGFPVALVAQDGLSDLDQIPFAIDALFIGGSDAYKLGPAVARLVTQAKAAGLWVHMGRVNSLKRLRYAASIGCDSADGTFIGFKPSENYGRVIAWLDELASSPA